MKFTFSVLALFLAGCATGPRCGDLVEARAVYTQKNSCEIRIRHVTIGAELNIPKVLKRPDIAGMELQWVEPGLVGGQIVLGHFVLAPHSQTERKSP